MYADFIPVVVCVRMVKSAYLFYILPSMILRAANFLVSGGIPRRAFGRSIVFCCDFTVSCFIVHCLFVYLALVYYFFTTITAAAATTAFGLYS